MSGEARTVKLSYIAGVAGPSLGVNDMRVAGPKPWGGGTLTAEWSVPESRALCALDIEHGHCPYRRPHARKLVDNG